MNRRFETYAVRGKCMNASFTIEAAYVVPIIMLWVMLWIFALFLYHDKNILKGAAYETVAVSCEERKINNVQEALRAKQYFDSRISGKLMLFSKVHTQAVWQEDVLYMEVKAEKGFLHVKVKARMHYTQPEKEIRKWKRLKEVGEKIGEAMENNLSERD